MTKREILFQIEIAINDACTNSNCEWLGHAGVEQESRNAYETVVGLINEIKSDRTCSTCRHHVDYSEYYGNCVRNGSPNATEYTWSCAGWENQDD